jgi:hypothetical protein
MSGDLFKSAAGGMGTLGLGNVLDGVKGSGCSGLVKASVPYNSSFNNISSSTPAAFAMPYLTQGLEQAQSIYNANRNPSNGDLQCWRGVSTGHARREVSLPR